MFFLKIPEFLPEVLILFYFLLLFYFIFYFNFIYLFIHSLLFCLFVCSLLFLCYSFTDSMFSLKTKCKLNNRKKKHLIFFDQIEGHMKTFGHF